MRRSKAAILNRCRHDRRTIADENVIFHARRITSLKISRGAYHQDHRDLRKTGKKYVSDDGARAIPARRDDGESVVGALTGSAQPTYGSTCQSPPARHSISRDAKSNLRAVVEGLNERLLSRRFGGVR